MVTSLTRLPLSHRVVIRHRNCFESMAVVFNQRNFSILDDCLWHKQHKSPVLKIIFRLSVEVRIVFHPALIELNSFSISLSFRSRYSSGLLTQRYTYC